MMKELEAEMSVQIIDSSKIHTEVTTAVYSLPMLGPDVLLTAVSPHNANTKHHKHHALQTHHATNTARYKQHNKDSRS